MEVVCGRVLVDLVDVLRETRRDETRREDNGLDWIGLVVILEDNDSGQRWNWN